MFLERKSQPTCLILRCGARGIPNSDLCCKQVKILITQTIFSNYLLLFSGPSWPGPASELAIAKESEPEPYCFPVFRWSLILVGLAMLVCVFVVLVQLLVDWGRG